MFFMPIGEAGVHQLAVVHFVHSPLAWLTRGTLHISCICVAARTRQVSILSCCQQRGLAMLLVNSPPTRWLKPLVATGLVAAMATLVFSAPASARPKPLDPNIPVSSTGAVATLGHPVPVTGESQHLGTGETLTGAAADAKPASGSGLGINSIVPPDQRWQPGSTTTFPHSAVVQITVNGSAHCSGWLYGADIVATAGHCVHTGGSGGSWYSGIEVWPGRNGGYAPYGSCGATSLYSVVGWATSGNEAYDYGAIKLNCSVGNSTGWFGYWWQSDSLAGYSTRICGYPGDKPNTQWCSDDQVRVSQSLQVFYWNDTVGGMSGSAVYQDRSGCGWCAMAIHAYGFPHNGWPHDSYNHGTRITEARFNNLWIWKYGSPPE
jgi:glutamyl endopeptidase